MLKFPIGLIELSPNQNQKVYDPGRIRTCNLLIRSQTRYPLRHWTDRVKIAV